jgi:NAD(P)-dependent dehydrogenase (short-subunit alcohol dehydrogenase family)
VKLTYRIDPADQHVMIVTVEDNGIGRQAAMKLASGDEGEKRSAATDILARRLAALSQETGKLHTVSTVDLDEGTMVTLVLPLHREWD